jgi:hypothetical protein
LPSWTRWCRPLLQRRDQVDGVAQDSHRTTDVLGVACLSRESGEDRGGVRAEHRDSRCVGDRRDEQRRGLPELAQVVRALAAVRQRGTEVAADRGSQRRRAGSGVQRLAEDAGGLVQLLGVRRVGPRPHQPAAEVVEDPDPRRGPEGRLRERRAELREGVFLVLQVSRQVEAGRECDGQVAEGLRVLGRSRGQVRQRLVQGVDCRIGVLDAIAVTGQLQQGAGVGGEDPSPGRASAEAKSGRHDHSPPGARHHVDRPELLRLQRVNPSGCATACSAAAIAPRTSGAASTAAEDVGRLPSGHGAPPWSLGPLCGMSVAAGQVPSCRRLGLHLDSGRAAATR